MSMIGNYWMADNETVRLIHDGGMATSDYIYGARGEENHLDIDKTWHAIHFTITGEMFGYNPDKPLSKVVLGGTPINDEDVGYGPALFLTADEVHAAAAALAEITKERFGEMFSLEDMTENDIYPITDDEDEEEFFDYVWQNFAALQEFFRNAAAKGLCIITCIN